jgi:rhodanese-related sulfurtransferase
MKNSNLKNSLLWVLVIAVVIGLTVTGELYGSRIDNATPPTETRTAEDITAEEAFTLIQANQQNPEFVIIDVRTPEEFAQGHLENAINIDYYSDTFSDETEALDKNKTYLIYCRSGARSSQALALMAVQNFTKVYNISGGINAWQAAGLPVLE